MSSSSSLDWKNYLLKWTYSPENKRDPGFAGGMYFVRVDGNKGELGGRIYLERKD